MNLSPDDRSITITSNPERNYHCGACRCCLWQSGKSAADPAQGPSTGYRW